MTTAVIMAGGDGRRLHPLTLKTPKPMLKVNGRPMLEWVLKRFVTQDITDIFISVRYLGEQIESYFGDGVNFGARIKYLRENDPLGTAGALGLLPAMAEPFIVINGDILTSVNFGDMLRYHETNGAVATVGAAVHSVEVPFGVLNAPDCVLASVEEKPVFSYPISAGVNVFSPEVLRHLRIMGATSMPEFLENLIAHGKKIMVFPISGGWLDIGTHENYGAANGAV